MPASPFEQLFDISPFPAVVSRLRDQAVIAINQRTSEMFGIPQAEAVGLITWGTTSIPLIVSVWLSRSTETAGPMTCC